jgi:hypothetical protein
VEIWVKPFKLEIFLANFWEVEQLVQALTSFEAELRGKGGGPWFRLACEIRAARKKLEKDADVEPAHEVRWPTTEIEEISHQSKKA